MTYRDGQLGFLTGLLVLALLSGSAMLVSCGSDEDRARTAPEVPDAGSVASGRDCVPYDDKCVTGTYCQYFEGRTRCLEEGPIARDEPCGNERCQRGSICMFGSSLYGNLCQQPCPLDDVDFRCDIGRHTCFPATDDAGMALPFGVCRY
jgi:hypothetical protein